MLPASKEADVQHLALRGRIVDDILRDYVVLYDVVYHSAALHASQLQASEVTTVKKGAVVSGTLTEDVDGPFIRVCVDPLTGAVVREDSSSSQSESSVCFCFLPLGYLSRMDGVLPEVPSVMFTRRMSAVMSTSNLCDEFRLRHAICETVTSDRASDCDTSDACTDSDRTCQC